MLVKRGCRSDEARGVEKERNAGGGGEGGVHHEGTLVQVLSDQPELQDLGLGLALLWGSLTLRHQRLLGLVSSQLTAPSLHSPHIYIKSPT